MTNFQYALLGIFIFFILAGVVVFAKFGGVGGNNGANAGATVTIWGTLPKDTMNNLIRDFGVNAVYREESAGSFETDLVNALAEGNGPDIALMPQSLILSEQSKIYPIPTAVYPVSQLQSTFIQEGEMFNTKDGILGIPFVIDPLVMYWNRDLFSNAGIALPPTHWDDLYNLVPQLTVKDQDSTIHQSTVSLGGYSNVSQAKDILSALLLQVGDPMVALDYDGNYSSKLAESRNGLGKSIASDVLDFYTSFADPLKTQYSWNDSLPSSKSYFLSGNLALYFGFASELSDLQNKNPNLNFSVATIPQARDVSVKSTFGNLQALVILNNSAHKADAFNAITKLTSADAITSLSASTHLPPVRRDLLANKPSDSAASSFYDSALQSKGWLDPSSSGTDSIFGTMVQSITSGKSDSNDAVASASTQIGELLRPYRKNTNATSN
ncbi:MAG: extracellular solute-binding protein [bacterium]